MGSASSRSSPPVVVAPPLVSHGALMLVVAAVAAVLLILSAPPAKSGQVSARRVYSLSACLLAAATLLLTVAEPGISAIDALYLSVMTFTTIGYGDIEHPASAPGRMLVSLLALGGVAFFGVTIELCHSLRARTDGALLARLGLGLDSAAGALALLAVNVLGGVALCRLLTEDPALPTGWLDAAYWSVVTTTSVGYGDFHPTSDAGKLCVCAYALCSMQAAANAMDLAKQQLLRLCTRAPATPAKRD